MPGTPSKASPKLTAFWRKVSPEMILSEAVEVCNSPDVVRGRLLPTTVTVFKPIDCSVPCACERIGVLIKRIDKTMGFSVVCAILASHHILKKCYYITLHYLYNKIFEKKPRNRQKFFKIIRLLHLMALICINPNFREVNDVNTNSAIFGYRIIKIYEGIKSVLSRMVEKMAKLHTCQKARLCVRFLRVHQAR
ncbi:hypothetical protein NEIPOLOT_02548 [Neisseria polysaccharea ATCC 43768]|nr:hypothetical protein NEIPOLOT_02548 [Neisseria polysaccharea ATCC 43768]